MLSRQLNRRSVVVCCQLHSNVHATAIRPHSAQAALKHNVNHDEQRVKWEKARPFSELPGPGKLEFLRGLMPGGRFQNKSLGDLLLEFRKVYGDIFRFPGLFGKRDIITVFNPEDFQTVFRNEGLWPFRRSFDTIVHHREQHRGEFFQGVSGILVTNDESWAKVRSIVNPILMQPKNVRLYLNTMMEVNNEFITRIREIRDPKTNEMPETFEDEIKRLALESAAAVVLNTQLGLIRKNRDSEESRALLNCLRDVFDLTYDLDVLPSIWKYFKTPKFHRMMKNLDHMVSFSNKYIDEAIARIEQDADGHLTKELGKEKSVLEKMLKADRRIAIVMALDFMMGGVDTTTTSLVGILLGLAKNPEKQQKLREELLQVLPHKESTFTLESMKNLPYLRACIKEGIRLYPIGPGLVRTVPVDVVLSGYQVPHDTDLAIASNLLLRDENYVANANSFIPERWIRTEEKHKNGEISDPFVYIPFGFGPRSCIGKRIVDLELEIAVARLVRNFHIEFNYPIDKAFKATLFNVPDIPLNFKFVEMTA